MWLEETDTDMTRGVYKGKFTAYKDIADGIKNKYFEK
jgi:hypothetical protein